MKLPRTTLFSLQLPSPKVVVPNGSGFVSVNIVSRGEIRTTHPIGSGVWNAGTAHVLNHDGVRFAQNASGLHLDSESGRCFSRYVQFIWDELKLGGEFLRSPLATAEIENSLGALLLSAIQGDGPEVDSRHTDHREIAIKQAEEYILGNLHKPLRVADVASAVGVSVPTLNRAFRKRHGMGPKVFVNRRRLDRVWSSLLNADPQSTTVTEVATSTGYFHLVR